MPLYDKLTPKDRLVVDGFAHWVSTLRSNCKPELAMTLGVLYGENMGVHFYQKLLFHFEGDVVKWFNSLDAHNETTFLSNHLITKHAFKMTEAEYWAKRLEGKSSNEIEDILTYTGTDWSDNIELSNLGPCRYAEITFDDGSVLEILDDENELDKPVTLNILK